MSDRHHFESVLGTALSELIPLIEAAVLALDKPGTRALRRKIDGQFHFVVGAYDLVRRESLSDYDCSKLVLPRYRRVTEVWPGRVAYETRKAEAAQQSEQVPEPPAPTSGLRLVVDNVIRTRRAPPLASPVPGGAA